MAVFAIGDVQGCFDELSQLLDRCGFRKTRDRLWFVGDLVNRGPKSLDVLRFVRDLGDRAATVLGNHDLHLVTQYEGFERARSDDTFQDVLDAPDARELVDWLRTRPLLHVGQGWAMVHAGLLPLWSIEKARRLAREVESALRSRDYRRFLANMYGSRPASWRDGLAGWDRLRVVVNAMTRMRFCNAAGTMELRAKGSRPPRGYRRWFDTYRRSTPVVFGHWSQLGLTLGERCVGLDSGCVWGGKLTAMRLGDRALYQVACRGYQAAGGE